MATNQTRQIGPNQVATLAVPRDWAVNRPINKVRAMEISIGGVMACARLGTADSPSMAESTEIAGVMMASP